MRILITTPLSGRDVGGPAHYGPKLQEEFEKLGHEVVLVAYTTEKKMPIGIRHLYFFFKIIPRILASDVVITLDTFSVGVPTVLAASLLGRRVVVRIGGDFLWESYVNRTGHPITLKNFYREIPELNLKEKIVFRLTKEVLGRADILAFNTNWFREIWIKPYSISRDKTRVVLHPIPPKEEGRETLAKTFLWAGRINKVKNTDMLKRVASEVSLLYPEFKLDLATNLPHSEVIERIKSSYAVVLPSLSDTCPLFIIEAMSLGKPYIVTEETGLREIYDKGGIFIDPLDRESLIDAFNTMIQPENYMEFKKESALFELRRDWATVAGEFISLCQ